MAEPLVNQFGPSIPKQIGAMLAAVGRFDARAFVATALQGYDSLNLMQRAIKIADALHAHLPREYPDAIELLLKSIGPRRVATEGDGMASFLYLPHTLFVARHGLDHFDRSMQAQYQLTQRFTAEFSIRPFIQRHPEKTLALLAQWARDGSPHVRRLVSEGTRPRLPWAGRLREFQKDPTPVLQLLELLKDDPHPYVRRSVANNLNDIGKDHPDVLIATVRRWLRGADENRAWIVKHALRSAIKRADPGALSVLGYGAPTQVRVSDVRIAPKRVRIGERIQIAFAVSNATRKPQDVLVDFRIHFVKANGARKPKVFKLKEMTLRPGETAQLSKTVALHEMTTRKHYPGQHRVDVVLNGTAQPLGDFVLSKSS